MSEIGSKENCRWIHCFKLVNKAKRSRMSFKTKRLMCQRQSFIHYCACQGRSLLKPNLIAIE